MSAHRITDLIRHICLILLLAISGFALTALSPAFAQQTGPAPTDGGARDSGRNPTAESVNETSLFRQSPRIEGTISIPDAKAAVLEQPQGRDWRAFHERYLPWIGGVAVIGMLALLAIAYLAIGAVGGHDQEGGIKILRFTSLERFAHWLTATCFIVLALSGLNYIFGKKLLMPLIGPDAFTFLSQWAKYAHNYLAWPFMLGVVLMFLVWVRDNIPNRVDWQWIKAGGGVFGTHAHAERFNAGQKGIFWIVVIGGVAMSVTGVILLFPFDWTNIAGMQIAQVVHALVGVGFIAVMMVHIYIGTIGVKGAYDAMGSGEVDLAWAKTHHDLWVEREQARNASGPQVARGSVPAAE